MNNYHLSINGVIIIYPMSLLIVMKSLSVYYYALFYLPVTCSFHHHYIVRLVQSSPRHSNNSYFRLCSTSGDNEFDPLLSPHAYSRGTDAGPVFSKNGENFDIDAISKVENISDLEGDDEDDDDDDWSPFKMQTVKDDFKGATDNQYGVEKSIFTRPWSVTMNSGVESDSNSTSNSITKDIDPANFDPLLSPHCYPKGTSGPVVTQQQPLSSSPSQTSKIGVLLVDHGSRREASNAHLETLAALYQQRAPSHYIIRAAHMELASPSIKDGIKLLIEEDRVDKIVCHPYFLSPGRHVSEDIPQLVQEAILDLKVGVDVVTTNHVGSNIDRMIDMIGAIVDDTIGDDTKNYQQSGFVPKDPSSLGGFFGEIQRMLDEQL